MDFIKGAYLLTLVFYACVYTVAPLHMDAEEMLELRQDRNLMLASAESAQIGETTTHPVEQAEAGANETAAEEPFVPETTTAVTENTSSTKPHNPTNKSSNKNNGSNSKMNLNKATVNGSGKTGKKSKPGNKRPVLFSGEAQDPVCQYTGPCRGKSGKRCRKGSICTNIPGKKRGWCCKKRPQKAAKCPHGQDGECGTIQGLVCRPGTTCMFKLNFPDAGGKCCIDKPSDGQCLYGQDGECGTNRGLVCRTGTTCMFRKKTPNAKGKCCIDKPGEKLCPSGVIGSTCTRSEDCGPQFTCRFGNCCRDQKQTCPAGWIEGSPCKLTGFLKCKQGYECINGLCCGIPANLCPSGVVGSVCSVEMPCQIGFTCRFGFCCKNKVCPNGWSKGGVCNTRKGEPRCREGFSCINDICCQSKVKSNDNKPSAQQTPSGTVALQQNNAITTLDERKRQRMGQQESCNGKPVGICGGPSGVRCPGNSRCAYVNPKTGFGVCCKTAPEFCPSGVVGGVCSSRDPCQSGYSCRYGFCCRDSRCPRNFVEGGSCSLSNTCQKGYTCFNSSCCRVPEIFCPSGVLGSTCSRSSQCENGFTCRFGYCCRDQTCPNGAIGAGSCTFIRGKARCAYGYECLNNYCCPSQTRLK